jgi:hypothetical protein
VEEKEKRNDETETKTENETLKTGKNGPVTLSQTSFNLITHKGTSTADLYPMLQNVLIVYFMNNHNKLV